MNYEIKNEYENELELYVDEINFEELDYTMNFNCAGSVFTGASLACAGSCGSSVSSAGSFSSATG
ncbi:thiocillin family RiPP [Macrococcus equi]|uniref:thiocillin family RiPP n=1 Tax=Macrococcus equi TaxID=3395462 RepID=UPI0039BE3AE0